MGAHFNGKIREARDRKDGPKMGGLDPVSYEYKVDHKFRCFSLFQSLLSLDRDLNLDFEIDLES